MTEPIRPPIGAMVRIYCNGVYHKGRIVRQGPKFSTVEYTQKNGKIKQVRTLIYPEGTLLSDTNWGKGARTAFYRVAVQPVEGAPEEKPREPLPGQMDLF